MLWLANMNPAFATFDELFDDDRLAQKTAYTDLIDGLQQFFETQPGFGSDKMSLIAFLRAPALAEPDSLAGQLRYLRTRWGLVLTPFLDRLIITLDVLHEEEVAMWMRMHPSTGPGPAVQRTRPGRPRERVREASARTATGCRAWCCWRRTPTSGSTSSRKRYGRGISRLDEIPDEELEALARRGFTGLWLIGLWERSQASQRIKQWRGNPEAAASAYSLMDYTHRRRPGRRATRSRTCATAARRAASA